MKATVDMESTGIGTRISANSIGTASQTITVDTTNDNEKIDYDRLERRQSEHLWIWLVSA